MNVNYDIIWAIMPCIALGILCGFGKYFHSFIEDDTDEKKANWRKLIGSMLSSGIISFIVFVLLDEFTDFKFMSKLALCSAVAFFGVDKSLDLVGRAIELARGIGIKKDGGAK